MTPFVLGVDSGGSGLRLALAPAPAPAEGSESTEGTEGTGTAAAAAPRIVARRDSPRPVRTGEKGIDADDMLAYLLPAARGLLAEAEPGGTGRITAVCVGAAGMATLGDALRGTLPGVLARALGVRRVALAADAVTAFAGALGERPGAVVAAGTGMIALGTDLRTWRRADGWGHLLGDCGGGAWIGRAGLEAAMRALDGREGGSAGLRARAEALFGPVAGLPGQLYPRADRPAVLASFAPEVARCAGAVPADAVAERILRAAARQIAVSAAAVCPAGGGDRGGDGGAVALTGGLFRLGEPLLAPVREELAARLPRARAVPAAGDPLEGAVLVAGRLAAGTLRLPADGTLLHVS